MKISDIKKKIAFLRQYIIWKKLARTNVPVTYSAEQNHLLIMPADSETIGGSRGDEAMIMSTISHYKKIDPNYKISIIITNGEDYLKSLNIKNLNIIPSYRGNYPLERIYKSILENKPSDVVVVGADCMDGHYAPLISLMLLAIYDLCYRTPNIRTHILGFSWNKHPSRRMKYAFSTLKKLPFNIRDKYSLLRLKKDTGLDNLTLVADEAFMLEPDYNSVGYNKAKAWLNDHKLTYNIGFNLHPMLKDYSSEKEIEEDAIIVAEKLGLALDKHNDITLMLISHDDRRAISDNTMLDVVYQILAKQGYSNRVYYDPTVYRSSQIKGICKLLDGLISSRMHLAIAALGQSKPIMAVSYQDKFEGLYNHFSYDTLYLMAPEQLMSDEFVLKFDLFLDSISELTAIVDANLPKVLQLSRKNLI